MSKPIHSLLLSAALLVSPAAAAFPPGPTSATPASAWVGPGANFPVIAYFPNWVDMPTNTTVEFERLTHINYSFVLPTSGGGVQSPNDGMMRELARLAHAKNVKVGIAIGGWNDGNTTVSSSNPRCRRMPEARRCCVSAAGASSAASITPPWRTAPGPFSGQCCR